MKRSRCVALAAVAATMLGCALSASGGRAPGAVAPKLAKSTYFEEGSLLALVVGVRPALSRGDRRYIPLEVSVVNKGMPVATLTAESFTLVDAKGHSLPVAGREELARDYGSTDLDRRLGEVDSVLQRKYQTYDRAPSNFTPGFDDPVLRREVKLSRFSYFLDMIYFPNPAVPTPPGPYDLLIRVQELPDPLVVRFRIDGS